MAFVEIMNIQLILFFKNINMRPDKLADSLNKKLNNYFDGFPNIIKTQDNAPLEIPVVFYTTETGNDLMQLSKDRLIFISNKNIDMEYNDFIISFINKSIDLITVKDFAVSRVGIVGNIFLKEKDPDSFITNKIICSRGIKSIKGIGKKDLSEIKIGYNYVGSYNGIAINNVINIQSGIVATQETNEKHNAVLYGIDINTVGIDNDIENTFLSNFIKDKVNIFSKNSFEEAFYG
ncbi:hypothetical protein AB4095_16495 [Bilophila wadsworthia]|uniref:hypothetical protein n=1 Tax=Bilophila wadsworthia TaxID=35833 RepID=UPI0034CFD286